MRIRIGILLAYLLLGCILMEDIQPYFSGLQWMEMCESKVENSEKEGKKEGESDDEWKEFKNRQAVFILQDLAAAAHWSSAIADAETIPAAAYRTIFSPPPNRV
ncbi:MAG TPA: hypothetical protein DCF33_12425 [Saprospirales bacterium]|nr:hypothetical protein [Saprospirales bacterium]